MCLKCIYENMNIEYEVLWMKRRVKLKNLIILVLSMIFIIGFIRQERAINRIEKEQKQRKEQLEEIKQENQRYKEQKNMIATGEYIEKLAREKLNMIKPGEWSVLNKKNDSNS